MTRAVLSWRALSDRRGCGEGEHGPPITQPRPQLSLLRQLFLISASIASKYRIITSVELEDLITHLILSTLNTLEWNVCRGALSGTQPCLPTIVWVKYSTKCFLIIATLRCREHIAKALEALWDFRYRPIQALSDMQGVALEKKSLSPRFRSSCGTPLQIGKLHYQHMLQIVLKLLRLINHGVELTRTPV